jgi:hypothetical protein
MRLFAIGLEFPQHVPMRAIMVSPPRCRIQWTVGSRSSG